MTDAHPSSSSTQSNKSTQGKAKTILASEQTETTLELAQGPTTMIGTQAVGGDDPVQAMLLYGAQGVFGGGSVDRQVGRLGDARLAMVQRQALAARIGRVQGNRHLTGVVAATKGENHTTSTSASFIEPHNGSSNGIDPLSTVAPLNDHGPKIPTNGASDQAELSSNQAPPFGAIQRSTDEEAPGFWDSLESRASDAWESVSSTASDLWDQATDAVSDVVAGVQSSVMSGLESLQSGWEGIQTLAENAVDTIQSYTQNLTQSLTSPFAALGEAIVRLNGDAIQSAWGNITGAVGSAWEWIQGEGQGEVETLENEWTGLDETASSIFSELGQVAQDVLGGLGDQATAVWDSLVSNWNAVKAKVTEVVSEAVESIGGVWQRLQEFSITELVETVTQASDLTEAIQEARDNPESVAGPLAQAVMTKLEGAPAEAQTQASQIVGENMPNSPQESGGGAVVMRAPDPTQSVGAVQRTRTGAQEFLNGVGQTLVDLWQNLDLEQIVIQILIDLALTVLLPIGLVVDIVELGKALYEKGQHFFAISSLDDIQSNISHLFDIPLIIWRYLNTMLERLYVWFFLVSVALGAAAGAGVGGPIGAIGGTIIGLAPGAAGGAASGGAVGIAAGAGAGAAFAGAVGLGVLGSFMAAELASAVKAFLDLVFVTQTEDEKKVDYGQFIVSILGLGIVTALLALSALAARFARPIMSAAARRVIGRLPNSVQKFLEDFAGGFTRRSRELLGGGRERIPDKEGTPPKSIDGTKPLPEFKDIPLGEQIGEGRYKIVYTIEGQEDLAIGILKPDADPGSIVKEIGLLKKLENLGMPTVEVLGTTTHGDNPAMVMRRYAIGSKDIIYKGGSLEALNIRSLEDLTKIRQLIIDNRLTIADLQFLIGNNGKVVIADPFLVEIGPPTVGPVDEMIEKVSEKLLKEAMVPGQGYSRSGLAIVLGNLVPNDILDKFLEKAISQVGFLEKQGDNYFLKLDSE